jgi:hypothetical protein
MNCKTANSTINFLNKNIVTPILILGVIIAGLFIQCSEEKKKSNDVDKWVFESARKDINTLTEHFNPLYYRASSIEVSKKPGIYHSDSLTIKFSAPNTTFFVLIYKNDTITSKGSTISFSIYDFPNKLSQIPTSSKNYIKYAHNWNEPIGDFSTLHQLKLLAYNESTIVDSLNINYILGAKTNDKLPIANFRADRNWLFDADSGCYVPGNSFNPKNENNSGNYYLFKKRKQSCHLQLIDSNNEYINESFKWRIHGLMTPKAPQKSLRIYLNGANNVKELLKLNHKADKIILRSAYSGWGTKPFVDGFIADACRNLNLDVMAYKPVKMYLNGEYWGIHGVRERIDLKAIANKYDIKKKKLIDADDKGYTNNKPGKLNKLLKIIKNDPNLPYDSVIVNYNLPSLIDWLAAEMFFQNNDWPGNNTFLWKQKSKSHKWKFILIDMDACIWKPDQNMFNEVINNESKDWGNIFISYLFNQKPFVLAFKERVDYLLENDFSPERLSKILLSYKELFDPAIEEHYYRWGQKDGIEDYYNGLNTMKKFCLKRQEHFRNNLKQFILLKKFE